MEIMIFKVKNGISKVLEWCITLEIFDYYTLKCNIYISSRDL
jgi:hypothetical protein